MRKTKDDATSQIKSIILQAEVHGTVDSFINTYGWVKQITSPGWRHETSTWTWCTGKTQRDRVEREVGGGIGMGNTWKSMANSCQCMTKTTTTL